MTVWHQNGGGPAFVVIEVEGSKIADDFGRTETDSWGSADTGDAWTNTGGAADDYLVNGSVAAHLLDSVNVARNSTVGTNLDDVNIMINQMFCGVVPTGAPIQVGLVARWVDANNYLFARLFLLDDNTALINIAAVVGGTETISSLVAVDGLTASGSRAAMRFQVEGSALRARAWDNTTTEPSTWQVELDHTGLNYGAVGVRSILQTGNTNNSPVIFTYDRFRAEITEWFDIAADVLHAEGGLSVDEAGRLTELERTDNAALRLVVDNVGGPYTPGALGARYELRQGQRIRVRETVGRQSRHLFTGTLQQSEAVFGAHDNDATVVLSAVDLFGELEQGGRTFISTLGEYIRYTGGSSLAGYWSMGEGSAATQCEHALPGQGPLTIERRADDGHNAPAHSLVAFGATEGPPMDDITCVEFNPLVSGGSLIARDRLVWREVSGVNFDDVEAVAVSLWYKPSSEVPGQQIMVARSLDFVNSIVMNAGSSTWTTSFDSAAGAMSVQGLGVEYDVWHLITARFVTATGAVSMWVDKLEFAGVIGPGTTGPIESILVDAQSPGSAGCHLQLYAGPTSVVNRDLHLAQYEQGTNRYTGGLRFQRTDERFTTACAYAGITGPQADYGTVWMQRAELAGKTFGQVVDEVVRTEQGRAFVDPAGVPTFHSRIRTRYNV